MSALGQKRTFAVQNGMSALPPIATAKADIPRYYSMRHCVRGLHFAKHRNCTSSQQSHEHPGLFLRMHNWCSTLQRFLQEA